MTWRILVRAGEVRRVEAYEQRRTKRGDRWTKGRRLGMRNVSSHPHAGMRPDERRVALVLRELPHASYWGPHLDGIAVGPMVEALEGSPFVGWAGAAELGVRVVRAQRLSLSLVPAGDDAHRLELLLDGDPAPPPFAVADGYLIHADEARDLIRFARPTLSQAAVLRVLAKRPLEADPADLARLIPHLRRLDSHFPLTLPTALDGETVEVPSDPFLRLRLEVDGLTVCARVRLGQACLPPGSGPATQSQWIDGRRCRTQRDLAAEIAATEALAERLGLPLRAPTWEGELVGDPALDLLERLQDEPEVDRVSGCSGSPKRSPSVSAGCATPRTRAATNSRSDPARRRSWRTCSSTSGSQRSTRPGAPCRLGCAAPAGSSRSCRGGCGRSCAPISARVTTG